MAIRVAVDEAADGRGPAGGRPWTDRAIGLGEGIEQQAGGDLQPDGRIAALRVVAGGDGQIHRLQSPDDGALKRGALARAEALAG